MTQNLGHIFANTVLNTKNFVYLLKNIMWPCNLVVVRMTTEK